MNHSFRRTCPSKRFEGSTSCAMWPSSLMERIKFMVSFSHDRQSFHDSIMRKSSAQFSINYWEVDWMEDGRICPSHLFLSNYTTTQNNLQIKCTYIIIISLFQPSKCRNWRRQCRDSTSSTCNLLSSRKTRRSSRSTHQCWDLRRLLLERSRNWRCFPHNGRCQPRSSHTHT